MNEQVSAAADEAVGNVDAVRKAAESFRGSSIGTGDHGQCQQGDEFPWNFTDIYDKGTAGGSKDAIGKGITELEGMKEILEEIEKQKRI